ncbi:putative O family protein [Uncultured Caudovirales phage clone 2F_1]|uniref:O family protein n=1 Tax=Uncultured Caudovirales phage clone 2F_1 TaxID=2992576 RepID=A0A2H4JC99_9CAUD|nr:hypothetical protein [Acinetobacter radioresistens]YP_010092440.1 putative O family protein [Uncultured Caudovirales phage clone 2F_1]ASN71613.1 putative O family protein [Uncultured Caudovirales phage clone 2F_1]RJL74410.1 hypothetical protein D5055_02735 [Acinetobacter radioresistens]
MKKVLLSTNEYPIIASPQLAKELGMPAATFLQKLYFLLNETKKYKNKKNLTQHNNRRWWFHTYEEWVSTLGLFSVSSIKRAVSKLKQLGLIEINKLDPNKSMRVNYYTINYKKLKELFGIGVEVKASAPAATKGNNQKIVGTDTPACPEATAEDLATLQSQHRALYRQLRGLKVDITHDDPLIFKFADRPREVLAYAASASSRLDINRWQWHTVEQILPQHILQ